MPSLVNTLAKFKEPLPDWLAEGECLNFNRNNFFSARTFFYPGSGDDGHPLRICNPAHVLHAYVYVDSGDFEPINPDYVRHKQPLPDGYKRIHGEPVNEAVLFPAGWVRHGCYPNPTNPFNWYAVYEREKYLDDEHGAKRFAVLFIIRDGFESFDALYCQQDGTRAPFIILIQNYLGVQGTFAQGGELEELARISRQFPKFLLVGGEEIQWNGYYRVRADCDRGGMTRETRCLYV